MYSRGANSIAAQLGISAGAAKSIISKFYQNFPTVKQYVDESIAFCYKHGYVKTVWGRKVRIPELRLPPYEYKSKTPLDAQTKQEIESDLSNIWNRQKKLKKLKWYKENYGIIIKDNTGRIHAAKRQVVNSIIQGSATDMINEAIVLIGIDSKFKELGGKLLITVHDEIIGEAPKETAAETLQIMIRLMIEASSKKVSVPMKCDGEILERWAGVNIKDKIDNE
jgi:DNA polymerase-1